MRAEDETGSWDYYQMLVYLAWTSPFGVYASNVFAKSIMDRVFAWAAKQTAIATRTKNANIEHKLVRAKAKSKLTLRKAAALQSWVYSAPIESKGGARAQPDAGVQNQQSDTIKNDNQTMATGLADIAKEIREKLEKHTKGGEQKAPRTLETELVVAINIELRRPNCSDLAKNLDKWATLIPKKIENMTSAKTNKQYFMDLVFLFWLKKALSGIKAGNDSIEEFAKVKQDLVKNYGENKKNTKGTLRGKQKAVLETVQELAGRQTDQNDVPAAGPSWAVNDHLDLSCIYAALQPLDIAYEGAIKEHGRFNALVASKDERIQWPKMTHHRVIQKEASKVLWVCHMKDANYDWDEIPLPETKTFRMLKQRRAELAHALGGPELDDYSLRLVEVRLQAILYVHLLHVGAVDSLAPSNFRYLSPIFDLPVRACARARRSGWVALRGGGLFLVAADCSIRRVFQEKYRHVRKG